MSLQQEYNNLPVFCSPTELTYGFGKRDMYESKPIQIFNPYHHLIRFKFFTNAPDRWRVENTQGGIRPNNYVTTTVQLRDPRELTHPISDCLRIEIYRDNEPQAVGRKDILLNVSVLDAPSDSRTTGGFVEFSESSATGLHSAHTHQLRNKSINNLTRNQPPSASPALVVAHRSSSFYWLALAGLFACLLCLLLPPAPAPNSNGEKQQPQNTQQFLIPNWLRPSHVQHCVASYILGLLTMYFFLQV